MAVTLQQLCNCELTVLEKALADEVERIIDDILEANFIGGLSHVDISIPKQLPNKVIRELSHRYKDWTIKRGEGQNVIRFYPRFIVEST